MLLLFVVTVEAQLQRQLDSMYRVLEQTKNDTIIAFTHYELAWALKRRDLPVAKKHMDSALTKYQSLELPSKIALSNFQYSVLHRLAGEYDEAIISLGKYQDHVEKVKDTANWIFAYFEKGVIYSQKGDLQNSLEQFYAANSLSEKVGNEDMQSITSSSIGLVYIDLKKYQDAEVYFKNALDINKRRGVTSEQLGDVLNGLASAYKHQQNYPLALEYFNKALEVYEDNESEFGISITNFNKGLLYNEQGLYNKALPLLELAYTKQKANGFNTELILTISSLGEAHYELGNFQESEAFLSEGLQLEMKSKTAAKDLYFELYRVTSKKRKYQQALSYHETYVKYKDSIYNQENIQSINFLEKQFETEKKNKEIAEQQLEINQKESQIQKKKTLQVYLLIVIAFLLVVSALTWLAFKQKQKRKNQEILSLKREYQIKSLEALIEGEEKERFRIAKELHDGVNGDLSAIKYKLSSLLELNNSIIREAISMIDESCNQVRAISHNLVPPLLDKFSLLEAIEAFCESLNTANAVSIDFQAIGQPVQLLKKVEVNIFRIVQELVSNALKHAKAKEIHVQVSYLNNILQVTVEDDGVGFVKDHVELGIGLNNIESRLEYLKATVDFVSNAKGTSYTFEINISNE